MRRALCLLGLVLVLATPAAQAVDGQTALDRQAQAYGLEDLEEAGEAYLGETDLAQGLDVPSLLEGLFERGRAALWDVVKEAMGSCLLLLAVALFFSLAAAMGQGAGGDPLKIATLAAVLAITAIAVGDVNALLSMGEETIQTMQGLGDLLLPAVSMATAASGSPAAAAVKYSATILFSDLLIRLIQRLLIPLCYTYVAVNVAWAALGNDGLKRMGGMVKWCITTLLSVLLLVFIGYLNLSGVISGSADAATVKAAKFTISNLVPVVGGVISDTAETLLAGASVLRNTAGVFGMLAVLGICLLPFLHLGVHYLMYKLTAVLAATMAGEGRITGLIEALGSAFGLILAMTGSCGVLLIVAMTSAVSAVAG